MSEAPAQPRSSLSRRIEWWTWAILAVGGLAVAIRFAGIASRLSVDDAYTWLVASSPSAHVFLERLAANENTPPLSYLLVMVMPHFSPAWLRLPAAVAGVSMSVTCFFAFRAPLGDRVALTTALGVAVAPYLITYSNLARGFMLADLALLIVVWAYLRLADRETRSWWLVFVVAGVVAVYSEYSSVIFMLALLLSGLWLGVPRRRHLILAGTLILASLTPWIPQIVRAQGQVGVTKFGPPGATPSLTAVRDLPLALAFGEHAGTTSPTGRWILFILFLAVLASGVMIIRHRWHTIPEPGQLTLMLLAAIAVLAVLGHALAALFGIHVFTQRYLTILVPIGVCLGSAAIYSLDRRYVGCFVAAALVLLGGGNFVRRLGAQWEPSLAPAAAVARAQHPRTVLTNTPIVLYYLPWVHTIMDRPSNIGAGLANRCSRPCVVIDDTRAHGGTPRPVAGPQQGIGPFVLTVIR